MSDIGIFSTFDLFLMALIAGSPGFVVGAALGAWRWRQRRVIGLVLGGVAGFAVCLGGVLTWILWIK
jgi:hypothetical protein